MNWIQSYPYAIPLALVAVLLAIVLWRMAVARREQRAMLNRLNLSLSDFRRSVPAIVRRRRIIDIPAPDRARTLDRLNQLLQPAAPGHFHITSDSAHAWILPSDEESRCTVLAEAADLEVARELCDFYEKLVRSTLSQSL